MRTKKALFNILGSLINRLIGIFIAFFIAQKILINYGAEINGKISIIRQILKYLSLLEMGIGGSAIYLLYSALSDINVDKIKKILLESKNNYKKSGIYFSIGLFSLILFYTIKINNSKITIDSEMMALFLILSSNIILDFFIFSKYKVLLLANQEEYIISLSNTIQLIFNFLFSWLMIEKRYSIIAVQCGFFFSYLLRSIIIFYYSNRKYKDYFDFDAIKPSKLISQKKDVMWYEITWLVLSSSSLIIMSINYSYKEISVYAVYMMVIGNIGLFISIFNNSLTGGFGELLAQNKRKRFLDIYIQFEFGYLMLASYVFSTTYHLIQPFIDIYTYRVEDINYSNPLLVKLLIVLSLLNCYRVPTSKVIEVTGGYKKTVKSTKIICFIVIVSSFILGKISFEVILLGSILGYLLRIVIQVRYFISLEFKNSFKVINNILIPTLAFILSYFLIVSENFIVENYTEWIELAIKVSLKNLFIFIIITAIFNKLFFKSIMSRLRLICKF